MHTHSVPADSEHTALMQQNGREREGKKRTFLAMNRATKNDDQETTTHSLTHSPKRQELSKAAATANSAQLTQSFS